MTEAFKDVEKYSKSDMYRADDNVCMPVTYKKTWDDGFGARGWKLDVTIGDPEIIASTRETGRRIPTSVFVHDILDHFLSGFGVSGHRSEAMALAQLSSRTGSDPGPDYLQMINEDILLGRLNRESLRSFLPESLRVLVPDEADWSDREIMVFLQDRMGKDALTDLLLKRFYDLGDEGRTHAKDSWTKLGLDNNKRRSIGLALQQLLGSL